MKKSKDHIEREKGVFTKFASHRGWNDSDWYVSETNSALGDVYCSKTQEWYELKSATVPEMLESYEAIFKGQSEPSYFRGDLYNTARLIRKIKPQGCGSSCINLLFHYPFQLKWTPSMSPDTSVPTDILYPQIVSGFLPFFDMKGFQRIYLCTDEDYLELDSMDRLKQSIIDVERWFSKQSKSSTLFEDSRLRLLERKISDICSGVDFQGPVRTEVDGNDHWEYNSIVIKTEGHGSVLIDWRRARCLAENLPKFSELFKYASYAAYRHDPQIKEIVLKGM